MLKKVLVISCYFLFVSCENKSSQNRLPYYNTANFDPQFLSSNEAEKKINHVIANFSLTDQYNQTVTQKDIEGKIHIANFFFTSCGSICPKMTTNLLAIQDLLAKEKDVLLFSYSVMPWEDSVPVLKSFAKDYNIKSPNWRLLTGKKEEIYKLARKSYFAEKTRGFGRDTTEFLHTEHMLLIDKDKKIRGIYNATLELEIQQLIKDIYILKKSKNSWLQDLPITDKWF